MDDLGFNWYVIVYSANNMFIIWPICYNHLITTIKYGQSNICFIVTEFEVTTSFNQLFVQVKVYCAFATMNAFMSYNEKFLAVEFIPYSFPSN